MALDAFHCHPERSFVILSDLSLSIVILSDLSIVILSDLSIVILSDSEESHTQSTKILRWRSEWQAEAQLLANSY